MEQVFKRYTEWEDWQTGMWRKVPDQDRADLKQKAVALLSDTRALWSAMREVVNRWPIATAVNMTNMGQNRRAWLGQSACCFLHGVPEDVTREAWNSLADGTKAAANEVAMQIIQQWQMEHDNIPCRNAQLMLMY